MINEQPILHSNQRQAMYVPPLVGNGLTKFVIGHEHLNFHAENEENLNGIKILNVIKV